MKTIKDDIWRYWKKDCTIIIPTNGTIKKDGYAVMGRGVALQAKSYIHNIDGILGDRIKQFGNKVFYIASGTISFPVKHNWWEKADLNLIKDSAMQLVKLTEEIVLKDLLYLPKVGCGNGQLEWKDVEPILDLYLDDRFTIVDIK